MYRKRCWILITITEMQIKTTMRYLLVHISQNAHHQNAQKQMQERVMRKWKSPILLTEMLICKSLWRPVWRFLKKLKIKIWFSNPTLRYLSGQNHISKGYMHPNVHWSAVYTNQNLEATKCQFSDEW